MASGLFRLVGAIGRDKVVANTLASFAMLILIVLGGFILSRSMFGKSIIYKNKTFVQWYLDY